MESKFSSFISKSKISLFLIFILLEKVYNTKNEITIVIDTSISSDIIYTNYKENISEVDVNGNKSNISDYYNLLNKGINEITIKFNKSLETCEKMFYYLDNIVIIDFLNFDSSNVKSMSWMFYKCSSIKSLNLRKFNTSSVTDMTRMFSRCSSLLSLDLRSFNTSSVRSMSWMFSECSSLKSLNIEQFDVSSVFNLNYIFYGCSSLISLNLSNFYTINSS